MNMRHHVKKKVEIPAICPQGTGILISSTSFSDSPPCVEHRREHKIVLDNLLIVSPALCDIFTA